MRQGLVIWVALAGLLVGCANLPEARVASPGKGIPTNTIPPNYRQQVAQSLSRAVNPRDFRAARISRPVTRSLSAFGGEQPSVCVTADRIAGGENPAWIFLFENGQVSQMFEPSRAVGCHRLEWSAFLEFEKLG
jgi:hypothetical protein